MKDEDDDRRSSGFAIKIPTPWGWAEFRARGLGILAVLQFAALVGLGVLIWMHVRESSIGDREAALQRHAFQESMIGFGNALVELRVAQDKTTKEQQRTSSLVSEVVRAVVATDRERDRIRIQMQSDALRK